MSASRLARILLLSKEPSGERFWQCAVISPELGGCICMLRRSGAGKSGGQRVEPDLFDTALVHARKPSGSEVLYFAEDYEPVTRRSGLGQRYATLKAAAFWAGVLSRNLTAVPEDAETEFFSHAERAFNRLEEGISPQWVLLKALYLLLKLEGYPVRESWWQELPSASQRLAGKWLRMEFAATESGIDSDLKALLENLCRWTRAHTDLHLPEYA
jgi:hypothetical protein